MVKMKRVDDDDGDDAGGGFGGDNYVQKIQKLRLKDEIERVMVMKGEVQASGA